MTLFHKAPREVYRVYGEEEYLAGEDSIQAAAVSPDYNNDDDDQDTVVLPPPSHGFRAGLMGLALLAGVTASILGVIWLNATHRPRSASPVAVARTTTATTTTTQPETHPIPRPGFRGASPRAASHTTVPKGDTGGRTGSEAPNHSHAIVSPPKFEATSSESRGPIQVPGPSATPPASNEFEFER